MPAKKTIGMIFPDEGAFAYELIDVSFMTGWLVKHGFSHVGYRVDCTPGGKASTLAACAELESYNYLAPAARRLAQVGADVVIWGCMSASLYKGVSYCHTQASLLVAESGRPATSASHALLAALGALGAKRVDIMMAYMPEIADALVAFLSEAGLEVADVKHMKCRPEQRTFDLDYKAELAEFTKTLSPRSHPILLPSTSLNSLDLIPDFERIAGRPVLTANQLCLWYALQLLEPKRGVSGAGRLFAEGKLRAKAAKSA